MSVMDASEWFEQIILWVSIVVELLTTLFPF